MKFVKYFFTIMIVSLLCCSTFCSRKKSRLTRAQISFNGTANGGTLTIGYVPNPHCVHFYNVSIDTYAGESAESVVNRLARAVAYSKKIFGSSAADPNVEMDRLAQGSTLSMIGTNKYYLLAGSETGLGIPKPPLFLSSSYDKNAGMIEVRWLNPSDNNPYDSLYIHWRYISLPEDTIGSGGAKLIPGTPTNFIIKLPAEVNDLDTDIWIKGLRHEMPVEEMRAKSIPLSDDAIPSNVTAIHMTSNGYGQEEMDGIPFSSGISPNWVSWSTARNIHRKAFEQGDKYVGVRRNKPVRSLSTKPFYQIINAPPKGTIHGVYRKFIGLTPGHTYRLTACLSTLEMDSVKGDWSLSLQAIPSGPIYGDFTSEQLAGLASLPDGQHGLEAVQIISFGPGKTTKGIFDIVITGYTELKDGMTSSHITLPENVNEITVWTKFNCDVPWGKVGFSGVKLEDLTAIKNQKTPEQIIIEEQEQEIELLNWIKESLK